MCILLHIVLHIVDILKIEWRFFMKMSDILNYDSEEKQGIKIPLLSDEDEWLTKTINRQIEGLEDTSLIFDGSHTFHELYYHRMILFATICNNFSHYAWKSKLHHDGTMYKNSFIVGIDTPEGQITYHYPIEFWDNFKVKKYVLAPEWDGHTSNDINRLLSLTTEELN